jgi:hypothetical protein
MIELLWLRYRMLTAIDYWQLAYVKLFQLFLFFAKKQQLCSTLFAHVSLGPRTFV